MNEDEIYWQKQEEQSFETEEELLK